jgi:hypothetical protein
MHAALPRSSGPEEDGAMDGGMAHNSGRYAASPLVAYDRALETATDLLRMEVSPLVIGFELRRQHGFTEAQTDVVIQEASAALPRRDPRPHPSHRDDRGRRPGWTGG